jgi:5-methylcytosine-specific restriction endonuclease McrA
MKKKKPIDKRKLRNKADKLWSVNLMKERCEVCGDGSVLQGHHFYYKGSYPQLRYCPENHITLCRGCHFSLHQRDSKKIEEIIIERRGNIWYENLKAKSREPINPSSQTIKYYTEVITFLESLQCRVL